MRGKERGAELWWGKDAGDGRGELREGKIATLPCCASLWPFTNGVNEACRAERVRYSNL